MTDLRTSFRGGDGNCSSVADAAAAPFALHAVSE